MARKPPGPRSKNRGPVRDFELWRTVGQSIDPLQKRKSADPKKLLDALDETLSGNAPDAPQVRSEPPPRFARPAMPSYRPMVSASKIPPSQKSIEPNLKRRMARGREEIDATLDLHGLTQDQAHAALERFIAARAARGDRTLLIITGKGIKKTGYLQLEHKGVLREMVPLWLNAPDLAPFIAGIETAHQSHGGGGALYIRLKRLRER